MPPSVYYNYTVWYTGISNSGYFSTTFFRGEKGVGRGGKPLHFKGSIFHRVIPGIILRGISATRGLSKKYKDIIPVDCLFIQLCLISSYLPSDAEACMFLS